MCSSFAHRSPLRRPYSNVKSMVLVAQFGATAVGGIRQEEKAQRAVAASLESKPWIAPPLRYNEMPARTYSASNFGSITDRTVPVKVELCREGNFLVVQRGASRIQILRRSEQMQRGFLYSPL